MKARHLVNMLLEMNVLNTKDVDRELKRIVARVYDKRAKQWLMRVGRYYLLNIDELMAAGNPPEASIVSSEQSETGWIATAQAGEFTESGEGASKKEAENAAKEAAIQAYVDSKSLDVRPEYHPRNPWYFHPEQGWIETDRMRQPPPQPPAEEGEEWVYQSVAEPNKFFGSAEGGKTFVEIENADIFPSPDPKFIEPAEEGVGRWVRTQDIKGLLTPSDVRGEQFATHYGFESRHNPGTYAAYEGGWTIEKDNAWASVDPEQLKDKEMSLGGPKIVKKVPLESYYEPAFESRAAAMADYVLEARDKKRPPYKTTLHTAPEQTDDPRWGNIAQGRKPFWQRSREQAYKPWTAKQAKKSPLPGEGPSKADVKPWMYEPGGKKPKELDLFDPWSVGQQEVWQVINDIADWFNYVYSQVRGGTRDDEVVYQNISNPTLYLNDAGEWESIVNALHVEKEDRDDVEVPEGGRWVNPAIDKAKEAEAYLQNLTQYTANDMNGFHDVVMDAHEFKHDVEHDKSRFMKDVKTISRVGDLSLRRTTTLEGTKEVQDRPGYDSDKIPTWCVHNEGNYNTYARKGPLYFVDKRNKPYALVHWPSKQVKNEENIPASQALMQEIAPVFAANRREFPDAMMREATGTTFMCEFGGGESETSELAGYILQARGLR